MYRTCHSKYFDGCTLNTVCSSVGFMGGFRSHRNSPPLHAPHDASPPRQCTFGAGSVSSFTDVPGTAIHLYVLPFLLHAARPIDIAAHGSPSFHGAPTACSALIAAANSGTGPPFGGWPSNLTSSSFGAGAAVATATAPPAAGGDGGCPAGVERGRKVGMRKPPLTTHTVPASSPPGAPSCLPGTPSPPPPGGSSPPFSDPPAARASATPCAWMRAAALSNPDTSQSTKYFEAAPTDDRHVT
mmetsp:Transcript_16303/g.38078  ORF Transcript_16303/g.38078 Transcript_16303/m.38078 type:complete len:242 (-) Transcript_16303:29-754(-)